MPKPSKGTSKMVRVLIQLPKPMKQALDSLKDEGYTASSYLRHLLKNDLRARRESGWVAGRGWVNPPGSVWEAEGRAEREQAHHRRQEERRKQAERTGTHG